MKLPYDMSVYTGRFWIINSCGSRGIKAIFYPALFASLFDLSSSHHPHRKLNRIRGHFCVFVRHQHCSREKLRDNLQPFQAISRVSCLLKFLNRRISPTHPPRAHISLAITFSTVTTPQRTPRIPSLTVLLRPPPVTTACPPPSKCTCSEAKRCSSAVGTSALRIPVGGGQRIAPPPASARKGCESSSAAEGRSRGLGCRQAASKARASALRYCGARAGVSICTFALVKQVN